MPRTSTLLCLPLLAVLTGCFTYRATPEVYMSQANLPPGATVMAVHADPGNFLHGFVEGVLIDCGLSVLSTGLLSGSLPVANSTYVATDTTVYRTDRSPVYLRLFEDVKADYLLRYGFSGEGSLVYGFSASLIDPSTGKLISSYGRTYVLGHSAEQAMDDFYRALSTALQP